MSESNTPLFASIGANVAIAAAKFFAAAMTGSSAMISEGVHSLVDASDGLLLLLGRSRSRKPPNDSHTFGYGREAYFWTLVVAIVFFAVGGGVSAYEGIQHILHPEPIRDPTWSYAVLAFATLFDGTSWFIAVRAFRKYVGTEGWLGAMRRSKDPTRFSVVLEDSADLVGIVLAFAGVFLSHRYGLPVLDGAASVGVGLVLATVAVFLGVQCQGLLVGEPADPRLLSDVVRLASADPSVRAVENPLSVQLGPHSVLVVLAVQLAADGPASAVAGHLHGLRSSIRAAHPEIRFVYFDLRE